MDSEKNQHPRSLAREYAIKFLYQCECEKLFHFSDAHFNLFIRNFNIEPKVANFTSLIVKGYLENQDKVDSKIQSASHNWSLERMPTTDRCILRIACYELLEIPLQLKSSSTSHRIRKKYSTKNQVNLLMVF